jgi:hypothetical protein
LHTADIVTARTRFARASALLFVIIAASLAVGPTPTASGQDQVASEPLPPFRADPALPATIVLNPGQGLGQCHWLDPQILTVPYVGWAYDASPTASGWASVEPQNGVFNWGPLDAEIAKARNLGKRVWIQLLTTEGLTPQWAQAAGVVLVGSRGGTPVPWNEMYQRLLRGAVHAMAARYDEDPTVDAVNIMAGGCYGEMTICAPDADRDAWERAGYTNDNFIAAVKQIIDIYLDQDYQWEDGSHTHGFLKKPVVLQLGAGLYGHTTVVVAPVVEYAISTYGMRVWLKYNGYGGGFDMGWLYRQYEAATRVGYEPAGNSPDFLRNPKKYVQLALEQHASYLCLQSAYFEVADQNWLEARELAARYLGAQVAILGVEAPEAVEAGREYGFVTAWENRGTAPVVRPQRQGVKDFPASYSVQVSFVDPATGLASLEYTFTPLTPTTNWYSAQPITVETQLPIPSFVPAGDYDLRVALVNPDVSAQDETQRFRLLNTSLHDGAGRYTVGRIHVLNVGPPPSTPTPAVGPTATASPTPGLPPGPGGRQNWLDRIMNMLREFLRRLLRVFQ